MKRFFILALTVLLLLTGFSSMESSAYFVDIDDDDGGTPSTDIISPVINVDTSPITANEYAELVLPLCTVSDNIDSNLTCDVSGDDIDTTIEGTYFVTYEAMDNSGNVAIPRVLIVQVVDSVLFFENLHYDDYTYYGTVIDEGSQVKIGTDETIVDECTDSGLGYFKVGTQEKGKYISELDWVLFNPMWDYTIGDYYYDYIGEIGNAHFDVYEQYDICHQYTYFDKIATGLPSNFDNAVMWSKENNSLMSSAYDVYPTRTIYVPNSAIMYFVSLIETYGMDATAEILQAALQSAPGQVALFATVAFFTAYKVIAALVDVGVAYVFEVITAQAFITDLAKTFLTDVGINYLIDSIYDVDIFTDATAEAIDSGNGVAYSTVYAPYTATRYDIVDIWNPEDGIERAYCSGLSGIYFGTFEYFTLEELDQTLLDYLAQN